MKKISSKDNSIVKEAASLNEKKYRDSLGLYLIEGPNLVREYIEFGGRPRFIFLKAGASEEAARIAESSEELTAVYELSSDAFMKLSSGPSPQGIVAAAEKSDETAASFLAKVKDKNILVLDRLQDPGNVGTLIRNSEAFGFGGVVMIKGSADPYQPKCVRAAAGSIFRHPILFCKDGDEAISLLKAAGKTVYSACMNGEVMITKADLRKNTAIVIGNEGNGISDDILSSSIGLSIPMEGHTESLNAAVAGTIIMYESKRQRE